MGKYAGAVLTTAGQNLISAAIAAREVITFTQVQASSAAVPSGTNVESLTALTNVEQTVTPSNVGVYNGNIVQIIANFSNEEVATEYFMETLGIWAQRGSQAAVLFAVIQAITPDVMPQASQLAPTSLLYRIQITVTNADQVTMQVTSAGAATVADLDTVYKLTDWTTITSSEDLNDYTNAGNYTAATDAIAATLNNAPGTKAFSLKAEIDTSGTIMQIAREITGKTYFRYYVSSWSAWVVIASPDVLRTTDLVTNLDETATGKPLDASMGNYIDTNSLMMRGSLPSGTDINTVSDFGAYNLSGNYSYTNLPSGVTYGTLVVQKGLNNGSILEQMLFVPGNPVVLYLRSSTNSGSTWNAWHNVLTDSNLLNAFTATVAGVDALDSVAGKTLYDQSLVSRGTVPTGTNFNSWTTYGSYTISGSYSYTNLPSGVTAGIIVVIKGTYNSSICVQVVIVPVSPVKMYIRRTGNGGSSWSAWYAIPIGGVNATSANFDNTIVSFKAASTNWVYTGLSVSGGTYGKEYWVRLGWDSGTPIGIGVSDSSAVFSGDHIQYVQDGSTTSPARRTPVLYISPSETFYIWEKRAAIPSTANNDVLFVREL